MLSFEGVDMWEYGVRRVVGVGILLCLVCGLCACGYGWKQALRDARFERGTKRQRALDYFVRYLTRGMESKRRRDVAKWREATLREATYVA